MKKFLCLFLLVFAFQTTIAQSLLDSANQQINLKKYDFAITICQMIVKTSDNQHEIGEAYFSMGFCFKKQNAPLQAVTSYLYALKHYQLKEYKASVYTNLGNIYFSASMYQEAIEFYNYSDSLESDPYFKGKNLVNRAFAKRKIKQFVGALEDAELAIIIADSLNDSKLKFRALNELGLIKKDEEAFSEAIPYFNEANKLSVKNKNTYVNLGNTYKSIGETKVAVLNYRKAILNSSLRDQFRAYQNLANLYRIEGQLDSAETNYLRAKHLFTNISFPDIEFIKLFDELATFYKSINQTNLAIENFEELTQLLFEFNGTAQELKRRYHQEAITKTKIEFELNEEQIAQEKEHIIHLWIITSVCLSVLIWAVYNRQKLWKKFTNNKLISSELKDKIDKAYKKYPTS